MTEMNTWMDSISDRMAERITPITTKFTSNVWVKSLQESILAIVPMILVGSLITLVSILNNYWTWMPNLYPINQFTFGLMGLFVAAVLPYNLMQHKGMRERRWVAAMSGLSVFIVLIGPKFSEDGATVSFSFERFGATGMIGGFIAGLFVAVVFLLFARLRMFKRSTALPDFLVVWFESLIPILVVVTLAWWAVGIANIDLFTGILDAFAPLTNSAQSFVGFVLIYFVGIVLYSFGLSPWIVYTLALPFMLKGINDNAAAVASGHPATFINTSEVIYSGWIAVGGMGATLPLVFMMIFRAKSARLRAIGKASVVPGLFNINEPVIFGAPIAFNPTLMLPFWINGLIPPILTYAVLSAGLVPTPSSVFQMWYMPFPISTWIVSPAVSSILFFAVMFTLMSIVWYPFFRAYDRQAAAEDALDEEAALT